MRNLFIVCAFMFSALCVGQMSFSLDNDVDVTSPMSTTTANIGWFMSDDILVSFGMNDWDNFEVGARYYTGFCDNMFIEATTTATGTMVGKTEWDAEVGDFVPVMEDTYNSAGDVNGETQVMEASGSSEYAIGAAIGWTKSLGIWKLQFEPKIVLDDIQDFTPRLAWGLRFTL